jgi:hypothetical protein
MLTGGRKSINLGGSMLAERRQSAWRRNVASLKMAANEMAINGYEKAQRRNQCGEKHQSENGSAVA